MKLVETSTSDNYYLSTHLGLFSADTFWLHCTVLVICWSSFYVFLVFRFYTVSFLVWIRFTLISLGKFIACCLVWANASCWRPNFYLWWAVSLALIFHFHLSIHYFSYMVKSISFMSIFKYDVTCITLVQYMYFSPYNYSL